MTDVLLRHSEPLYTLSCMALYRQGHSYLSITHSCVMGCPSSLIDPHHFRPRPKYTYILRIISTMLLSFRPSIYPSPRRRAPPTNEG